MNKNKYDIFLSDAPSEALTVKASTKEEATRIAKNYIRAWSLDASIIKIELNKEA